jgi:tRNA(Phe) wybutosine-synthesizing methylase Tyw3
MTNAELATHLENVVNEAGYKTEPFKGLSKGFFVRVPQTGQTLSVAVATETDANPALTLRRMIP